MKTVLITGISGFIGSHLAVNLLRAGYRVRGTVRDMSRADSLSALLTGYAGRDGLEIVQADLLDAGVWAGAARDVDVVCHLASPVPAAPPRDPGALIETAVTGTVNVLKGAHDAGVTRIIMTSSATAVTGSQRESRQYSSTDWSDPDDSNLTAYAMSKTRAEREAWAFARERNIHFTSICPGLVLGPALETDFGTSLEAIRKLLRREVPLLPRFGYEIIDVRDVADLIRICIENEASVDQRYLAANGFCWFREIAAMLGEQFPSHANRLPRHEMPNWLAHIARWFVPEIGSLLHELDCKKTLDAASARTLGWQPGEPEEAIRAAGESLIRLNLA